ncbi:MAG: hypothetical protein U5K79_18295 [Cyclobacteriaceae bacterium]|nr:hypothetical protein [Cyclobacteriaceae bacterium]
MFKKLLAREILIFFSSILFIGLIVGFMYSWNWIRDNRAHAMSQERREYFRESSLLHDYIILNELKGSSAIKGGTALEEMKKKFKLHGNSIISKPTKEDIIFQRESLEN